MPRLYLTPAARPLLDRLDALGTEMMDTVLEGIAPQSVVRMLDELDAIRENLRRCISNTAPQQEAVNG